ncbi:Crp/Fnr family transcriptional regulator [Magnetospira thiophila]
MTKDMLHEMWNRGTCRRLAAGESLFHRGDAPWGLFFLDSGEMQLLRGGQDGSTRVLQTLRPGETFAEASLFSDAYHCDCRATAPSVVRMVSRDRFMARLHQDPDFAIAFAQRLARQLQQARTRCEIRGIRSAEERVLMALRLLEESGDSIQIPGTWKLWAGDIGLSHEALYRVLAKLQKQGRIARDGRRVRLLQA